MTPTDRVVDRLTIRIDEDGTVGILKSQRWSMDKLDNILLRANA